MLAFVPGRDGPPEEDPMLTVGDRFPAFRLTATVSTDPATSFRELSDRDDAGRWKVFFFYPKDFTFVCPTEIAGFGRLHAEFANRDAQVYGGSTDSEFVHRAWREHEPLLRDLPFPLLADVRRDLARALGILDREEGVCLRATFVVDPEGVIRFASANDLSVGRNPEEVLRVLDALQSGGLTACGWQPGDPNLEAA
jgi:peroxiredoxin (alkyl hydroperoxide reductase subunit C)